MFPASFPPNPLPPLPPLKAPAVGRLFALLLLLPLKALGRLGSSKLSDEEEMDENGPFDKVADENPTGMTDPTCGVLLCDLPVRWGSFSGLLGTG